VVERNPLYELLERRAGGVRLLATGPFQQDDLGVACYHAKTGAVELLLNHPSAVALAANLLGRTRRLLVGTAVCMLANRHPVALAEEAALLDHLSGGRFRLGVGRGGPWVDLEVFGTGLDRYEHGLADSLDLLLRWLERDRVGADGPRFRFREVAVVPRPATRPRSPVVVAATSPATVEAAAARGLPLLLGLHAGDDHKAALSSTCSRSTRSARRSAAPSGWPPAPSALACAASCSWSRARATAAASWRTSPASAPRSPRALTSPAAGSAATRPKRSPGPEPGHQRPRRQPEDEQRSPGEEEVVGRLLQRAREDVADHQRDRWQHRTVEVVQDRPPVAHDEQDGPGQELGAEQDLEDRDQPPVQAVRLPPEQEQADPPQKQQSPTCHDHEAFELMEPGHDTFLLVAAG